MIPYYYIPTIHIPSVRKNLFLNISSLIEAPGAVKQKRSPTTDQKLSDRASEYALIQYLSTLVKKRNIIESFDFDFVEYLLENGANINNCNVIGQSPFHIVAKYWNIDVARFLLDNGRWKLSMLIQTAICCVLSTSTFIYSQANK